MDRLDRFYQVYQLLLDAEDKVADYEAEYLEIIQSEKTNRNEKGLACQFIPKFLKYFPHLSKVALEVQLDLVEDDDSTVRKLAVKHIPGFCKVSRQLIPKIADILTQMLQSEDSTELSTVHASLMTLMELDIKGTLQGILIQISTAEDDVVRKRAIEFLNAKLKVLPEDLVTRDVEEFFLEYCKKIFPKVSGQDFLSLLPALSQLKIAKTIPAQNTIVDIISTQLDDNAEFDVSPKNVAGFMNFLRQACPFLSLFVSSKKFVFYICLKVFPKLDEIKKLDNGHNLILGIFKVLAEISPFVHKDDNIEECSEIIFNELLKYVPLPPDNESENSTILDDPDLHFTHLESLLFTFLQFLKHDDKVLTASDNEARFKALKLRLQFLSRANTRALKHFQEARKSEMSKIRSGELKLKLIVERTMNNINALIKEFFRSPPSFKTTVALSWKLLASEAGIKRSSEGSSSSDVIIKRHRRACREIYVPPGARSGSHTSFFPVKDSANNKGKDD